MDSIEYPQSAKEWLSYHATGLSRPVGVACPECGDAGYVREDRHYTHEKFGEIEPCVACTEGSRREYLQIHCGLEISELEARLCNWQPGNWPVGEKERNAKRQQRIDALQVMRSAIEIRTGLFTFWGDFGSGKSYALAILINEFRTQLVEAHYTAFVDVLDELRKLYANKRETSGYWRRLMDVPVLAIDEVTRFSETGWAREKLFSLVNMRYRRRVSHLTIFATNQDPNAVLPPDEDIGYLFSRMREGHILELRGDMRKAIVE